MKKIVLIAATIIVALGAFIGCKKSNQAHTAEEKNAALLKKRFGFEKVTNHKDISKNVKLISALSLSPLVQARNLGDLSSELNFTNAIEYDYADGNKVLIIPFLADTRQAFVVTYRLDNVTEDVFDLNKVAVVKNHVDENGTGNLEIVLNDEIIEKSFNFGTEISFTENPELTLQLSETESRSLCQRKQGEKFRTCFDRMYDTICDGFWGCAAWYSNPQVPLLAVAVCGCYE